MHPIVTNFGVKHLYGKVNLNCEIHEFTTPGARQSGPKNAKNLKKKTSTDTE